MQGFFDLELLQRVLGHGDYAFDGSGLADRSWRLTNTANCIVVDRSRNGAPPVVSVMVEIPDEERRSILVAQLADDANRLSQERVLQDIDGLGEGFTATQGSTRKIAVVLPDRMIRLDLTAQDRAAPSVDAAIELVRNADANADAFDQTNA